MHKTAYLIVIYGNITIRRIYFEKIQIRFIQTLDYMGLAVATATVATLATVPPLPFAQV